MHVMVCRGKGFLWHQIRSMMNVIKGVGKGEIGLSMIDEMLNVEQRKYKYHHSLEEAENLLLYNCEYSKEELDFMYEETGFPLIQRFFSKLFQ